MMTRAILLREMAASEKHEEKLYKNLTIALFRKIQEPLKDLYDQTQSATANFTPITAAVLKANPKIVKTLRYCLAPVISQMRLGQLIGLATTDGFEERGLAPTSDQARRLAKWFKDYLNRERFPWLDRPDMKPAERGLAERCAKLWTVSLQSNQNTATDYRTRRKERQELAIAAALDGAGFTFQKDLGSPPPVVAGVKPAKPPRLGGINDINDVRPAHYVKEKKILAGSQKKQKTDLAVRPSAEPKLFCIEAKAVGIKLDSTKRLKELNDKYTDWKASALDITTVGVVAGMFSDAELVATIRQRELPVFFEHDLSKLTEFLLTREYYGAEWNPADLFKEVPATEVEQALETIQTAPVDSGADAEQQADGEPGDE